MEKIITPATPPQHDLENQIIGFAPHSPTLSDTSNISKETKRASNKLNVWLGYGRFIMQVLISLAILLNSILQLSISKSLTDQDKVVYFSTISLVFAAWMPSPKLPTDSSNSK